MERRGGGEGKLGKKGWIEYLLLAQTHLGHHLRLLVMAKNAWKGAKREKTVLWLKGKTGVREEKERRQGGDSLRRNLKKLQGMTWRLRP